MVSVLLPRYACSAVCAWPGVCLNYTLSVESARKSSPCGVNWFGKREKVRPARENWLDFGVFGRVGRVFSRFGQDWAVAGRVFSRGNGWRGCWANSFARADSCPGLRRCRGRVGRVFSRFGQGEAVAGRTFSRGNCWRGVPGEFFSRGNGWRGALGELFRAGMPKWRVARTLLRAGVIQ